MNSFNDDGGPAFPRQSTVADANDPTFKLGSAGMSVRVYAAIKLRIPESGCDWLDAMIRKARRVEIATKAMQGLLSSDVVRHYDQKKAIWQHPADAAEVAFEVADEMMSTSCGVPSGERDNVGKLIDAAADMLGGWRYMRQVHGDIDGVGWDRTEEAVKTAISAIKLERGGA